MEPENFIFMFLQNSVPISYSINTTVSMVTKILHIKLSTALTMISLKIYHLHKKIIIHK